MTLLLTRHFLVFAFQAFLFCQALAQPSNLSTTVTNTTCGMANGSVTAIATGCTGSCNYLWNTGAVTQTIQNLAVGTYIVTVSDASGQATASAFVAYGDSPGIEWEHNFGSSLLEIAASVQQTSDGGFIVAGYSESTNGDVEQPQGGFDFWVLKLHSDGGIQWKKNLGGTRFDLANSVQQTSDGGYVLAGQSKSSDGNASANHNPAGTTYDCWVLKLDPNGAIEWENNYGGINDDGIAAIRQTPDGGYIAAGGTYSTDGDVTSNYGWVDGWIIRIDASGNLLWQKNLGDSDHDDIYDLQLTTDGGYIVAGASNSTNFPMMNDPNYDCWVMKLDPDGNVQWGKYIGGPEGDEAKSVQQTPDGGYLVAGWAGDVGGDVSENYGIRDVWLIKLDPNGNLLWEKNYGGSGDDAASSISPTADGGFLILGASTSDDHDASGNHGSSDLWLIKIDADGNLLWQQSYGGTKAEQAGAAHQTADGGYILAGGSKSSNGDVGANKGNYDFWVAKLGDVSSSPLSLSSEQQLPASAPGVSDGEALVTFSGGTAPYDYEWSNGTTSGTDSSPTATGVTLDSLSEGDYLLTLTDANGCQDTSHFMIMAGSSLVCPMDSMVLVELYNSTGGAFWDDNAGWTVPGVPIISWENLVTNGQCAVNLTLGTNNLNGTIPSALANLSELQLLELFGNELNGGIPASLGSMPELLNLNLSQNNLSGGIPAALGNLPKLKTLSLWDNPLGGSIPPALGNLDNLEYLNLSFDTLNGSIPASLGGLSKLWYLDLNTNQLSGGIPAALGSLDSLKYLILSENNLSGGIPASLGGLEKLERLYLFKNQLTGSIPSALGDLDNLAYLWLHNNQLSGSIPPALGNMDKLRSLSLRSNQLSGSIPSELENLDTLVHLFLSYNQLSGSIPAGLANLPVLTRVELQNNQLSGIVPDFSGLSLTSLRLENNRLESLPDLNSITTWVEGLQVQNNRLTFDDILPNISIFNDASEYAPQDFIYTETTFNVAAGSSLTLDLEVDADVASNVYEWFKDGVLHSTITGNNKLVFNDIQAGDAGVYCCQVTNPNVPGLTLYSHCATIIVDNSPCTIGTDTVALRKIFNATGGPDDWTIKTNWLNNNVSVNDWYGVNTYQDCEVQELQLQGTHLSGNQVFTGNNLQGNLPADIGTLTELGVLYLQYNDLEGPLPPELGLCTKINFLRLAHNNFNGEIPWQLIGMIDSLFYLELDYNDFTGTIPKEFGMFKKLHYFECDHNLLNDTLPEELGHIDSLIALHLHCNKLPGKIPTTLADLPILELLDLDSNFFTGAVPDFNNPNSRLKRLRVNDNNLDELPVLTAITTWDNSLGALKVQRNRFTFEDILPNMPIFNAYSNSVYYPQDTIFHDTTIMRSPGDNLFVDLGIDANVPNNQYWWYKNGILITDIQMPIGRNEDFLQNIMVSDTGDYYCQVTNPGAPLLTLQSYCIHLNVSGCATSAILANVAVSADTACLGQSTQVMVTNLPSDFPAPVSFMYQIGSGSQATASNLQPVNGVATFALAGQPQAGVFQLNITEASAGDGCSYAVNFVENFLVSDPQVSLGSNFSLCPGASQVLNPTGSWQSYLWSGGTMDSTLNVNSTGTYAVTVTNAAGCTATASVQVSVSGNPQVSLGSNFSLCPGASQVLNPTGSWQSYLWSGGTMDSTLNVNSTGTYAVTVTNAAGCTATASVQVSVSGNPQVSLGSNFSLCPGASQVLNPTGSWQSYLWSGGSTDSTLNVNSAGAYAVTVTSPGGCTATDSVTVSMTSISLTTSVSDATCFQLVDGSITVNAMGGVSPYQFSLNGGPFQTDSTFNGLAAGSYPLAVLDLAGCIQAGTGAVGEPPKLTIAQQSSTNATCANNDGALNVTVSGGTAPYNYSWSNGGTAQDLDNLSAGTYSLTLTDDNGCADSSFSAIIAADQTGKPTANAGSDGLLPCFDATLTLNGNNSTGIGNLSFEWTNQDGDLVSGTANLLVSEPGNYLLTVTGSNGCTDTDLVQVALDPLLLSIQAFAGQDQEGICDGEVLLNASLPPGLTGEWTSSSSAMIEDETAPNTSVLDLEEGDNVFTWTISKPGCPDFSSDEVTIGQEATPSAEDDIFDLEQDSSHLKDNLTDNDESDTGWLLKVLNPPTEGELTYDQTGDFTWTPDRYTAQVQFNYSLCSETCPDLCDIATVTISMEEPKEDGGTYKGITANGDDKNDKLIFPELYNDAYPKNELLVFNRWGDVVHEEKNYKNDWYGTHDKTGQTLPDGTYFYILILDLVEEEPITGEILIVR